MTATATITRPTDTAAEKPPVTTKEIAFRYTSRGRCEAQCLGFHAIVDNRSGTTYAPYRATLKHGAAEVATQTFRRLQMAQAWLRESIVGFFTETTRFELADYTSEPDLEGRFARRSAQHARRHGLVILDFSETETTIDRRPTIVRTYRCRRAPDAGPRPDASLEQRSA